MYKTLPRHAIFETFSVKIGHLLLFLSLVFPFIRLQNNSPIYHLTSCLLFIEVDKGAKTSLRFVRYTWHWPNLWYPGRKGDVFRCRKIAAAQIWMRHGLNRLFTAHTRVPLLNSNDFFYISQFKHYLKDVFFHTWDWELMSQILCNLRHSGKFVTHV